MCVILKRSFLLISVKYGRCISSITRIQNGVQKYTLQIIAKIYNGIMRGWTRRTSLVHEILILNEWVLKIISKQSHSGIREKQNTDEKTSLNQFCYVIFCWNQSFFLQDNRTSFMVFCTIYLFFTFIQISWFSAKWLPWNCTKMLFPRNCERPGRKLTCEVDRFNKMKILNFLKFLFFGLTSASWSDDVQETAEFLIRGKLKIKI